MSSFIEKIPKSSEKTDDILQNENTHYNSTRKIGQRGKDKTKRKLNPKSLANLKQNHFKKEKRTPSSQDIIDTKEDVVPTLTIIKDVTNNPTTSKQDNVNFEESTQEDEMIYDVIQEDENIDFESDYDGITQSSLSIKTHGISALVLLASLGKGTAIVVAICLAGLVVYLLYKKWKERRTMQLDYDYEESAKL